MCQQHAADSDAQSQVATSQIGDSSQGQAVRCPRCGLQLRVDAGGPLDALVAAVQQHARVFHGHEVDRELVLARLTPA